MRNVKLTKKLKLGIGIILCITFSAISLLFYYSVRQQYLEETYRKTALLLSYIDATEQYVREELRPKMFHVLPKDEFIREAMSTTFVTKGITERFVKKFPEYLYRRVAVDPRNPKSMANDQEKELIGRLRWAHHGCQSFGDRAMGLWRWSGNVRELQNEVRKAVIFSRGEIITPQDFQYDPDSLPYYEDTVPIHSEFTYKEARRSLLEKFNVKYISGLLKDCHGNVSLAAKMANLERQSLQHLMRKYGINSEEFRNSANKI